MPQNHNARRLLPPTLTIIAVVCAFLFTPRFQNSVQAARGKGGESGVHVKGQVLLPDGRAANASAVVWLEAPGLHGTPLRHVIMDQKEKTFLPHILVITPGTQVLFWNHDTVFHNVFAQFEAKRFDLGIYPMNTNKPQTFNRTGIVSVLCNIHPRMGAYILIVDTPYFAIADKKGEFDLSGITAGNYTLHAWHESGAETKQPCTVSKDSNPALTITLKTH